MSLHKITLLLAFLITTLPAHAADTLVHRKPAAVLVQIRSESRKLNAMIKAKNRSGYEEVKKDAEEVKKRMILDFNRNFHRCPVYYFIDTNVDFIKNKQFDGILLDTAGNPVSNPVITSTSSNYWIVYYGYHISQSRREKVVKDEERYEYDPDSQPGKGLVVLNDRFQQLAFFYKLEYEQGFFIFRKKSKKFYYVSKHFDIEYFPFAHMLQEKDMNDTYNRRRIKDKK